MVPSLDDVMPYQLFAPPMDVTSVHVAPESVDVQIPEICPVFPLESKAASLVPSLDDVMPNKEFALPTDVASVHVAPESVDVQIFPP